MAGAPLGNTNNTKGKMWTDAIKRAIARRAKDHTIDGGLNELADEFLEAVSKGDAWAFKELGDRVEGKPAQSLTVEGGDNPLKMEGVLNLVRPTPKS